MIHLPLDGYAHCRNSLRHAQSLRRLTWGSKWGVPEMGRGDELMESEIALGLDDMAKLLSD